MKASLFAPAHLAWIFGIAVVAATTALLCRHKRLPQREVRIVLACLLAGCELQRYFHDGIRWPHGLPLQPCSITAWIAVAACITLAPLAGEYVYFTGIAGAGMAVITPDMGSQWPVRFFVTHGVLIVTACVLVFGRLVPLYPWAALRAWSLFITNAVAMYCFDMTFGTNYWYLRGKPGSVTAYNWLGPWPVYLYSVSLFGIVLFALLWLPWRYANGRRRGAVVKPAYSSESVVQRA